jgi:hypothetical protein
MIRREGGRKEGREEISDKRLVDLEIGRSTALGE